MRHGASCPSLRKIRVTLDRLESSDLKLALAMEEARHLSSWQAFLHSSSIGSLDDEYDSALGSLAWYECFSHSIYNVTHAIE